MNAQNTIAQKRYTMNEALKSVPYNKIREAKKAVMAILKITSPSQLNRIGRGECTPSLSQAKAVEEYFLREWGIIDVWQEIETPMLNKALKQPK